MPNEKAAEPLSEEKLAELEKHAACDDTYLTYDVRGLDSALYPVQTPYYLTIQPSGMRALLAEVRLGREALKALDELEEAATAEVNAANSVSGYMGARLSDARSILRKAGRR